MLLKLHRALHTRYERKHIPCMQPSKCCQCGSTNDYRMQGEGVYEAPEDLRARRRVGPPKRFAEGISTKVNSRIEQVPAKCPEVSKRHTKRVAGQAPHKRIVEKGSAAAAKKSSSACPVLPPRPHRRASVSPASPAPAQSKNDPPSSSQAAEPLVSPGLLHK